MTTERVIKLLEKRQEIAKKQDEVYKELEKIQIMISHYNKEIQDIDLEIFHGEEGYL